MDKVIHGLSPEKMDTAGHTEKAQKLFDDGGSFLLVV